MLSIQLQSEAAWSRGRKVQSQGGGACKGTESTCGVFTRIKITGVCLESHVEHVEKQLCCGPRRKTKQVAMKFRHSSRNLYHEMSRASRWAGLRLSRCSSMEVRRCVRGTPVSRPHCMSWKTARIERVSGNAGHLQLDGGQLIDRQQIQVFYVVMIHRLAGRKWHGLSPEQFCR